MIMFNSATNQQNELDMLREELEEIEEELEDEERLAEMQQLEPEELPIMADDEELD